MVALECACEKMILSTR